MAVISKITVQKKLKDRYNIFIDDQYSFSVDEATLIKLQLKKGQEVNDELLAEISTENMFNKAYGYAINFLSYRMRSIKEVKDYLEKKEFACDVIEKTILRLINEKYLDDLQFAKAFVQSRMNVSLKGPTIIKHELAAKGIRDVDIEESLRLFTYELQLDKVLQLFRKKGIKTKQTVSIAEQEKKLYTFIVSKGFSHEIVQNAFQLFKEENDDQQSDLQAIEYQGMKAVKKYSNKSGWEKKQLIRQFLFRRGFSFELIDQFIEAVENED